LDWFKLGYTLLGGLGIFFFGMKTLSESLQAVASQWIRRIIQTLTTNRCSAVFVGFLVTALIQSSSITTVMVVGFVNAGLMNLGQAIGVIFGANIGTTLTGWIISIKIGNYSLLLLGLGIFPILLSRNEKYGHYGKIVFALGMIFLGLETMSGAFGPLRSHEKFLDTMQIFSASSYPSVMATVMVGCALTFLVQSSSAMLGITMALAVSGAISFPTALALVLGENIGTTITALLASIGANTAAKRAAAAHATFNVLGVLTITMFFDSYRVLVDSVVSGDPDFLNSDGQKLFISGHIAAGHTMFNVVNTILFLPFIRQLEKLVTVLIPEARSKEKKTLELFGTTSTISPALAIEQATAEVIKMTELVDKTLEVTLQYLKGTSDERSLADQVRKYEVITDRIQMEITVFLGKVMEVPLTEIESRQVKSLLRMADELESVADYCQAIVNYANRAYREKFQFDDETKREIYALADHARGLFDNVRVIIQARAKLDLEELRPTWRQFNQAADDLKATHLARMGSGGIPPVASLTLSDILMSLRRIKNHTVNLAEAYAI
jgi:phosphate:Na+ symporter